MGQENYQWFMEPLNTMTNDAIAGSLSIDGEDTAENFCGIADAEGNIHHVWQVSIQIIQTFRASRSRNSWMEYAVWNRANRNCLLKRCAFMEKPKRRYSLNAQPRR